MTAQEGARAQALAYLETHNVVVLATRGPAGPWAAALFYVNDGFTLYWLSTPSSRHSRDLAGQPRVAAAVQEDYADWREIQGLQLEGRAGEVSGAVAERARRLYAAKYAFVGNAPAAIAAALAKVRVYGLAPERLHLTDNAAGFGSRREITLP